MNKNTLIAVILCILVLSIYESVFAPARVKKLKEAKTSQVIQNKEVALTNSVSAPIAPIVNDKTTSTNFKVINKDFQTTALRSELTNMGGSLHNIKIGQSHVMPVAHIGAIKDLDLSQYDLGSVETNQDKVSGSAAFSNDQINVSKSFTTIDQNAIKVRMEVSAKKSSSLETLSLVLLGLDFEKYKSDKRETMLDEYSYSVDDKIIRKGSVAKFEKKEEKTQAGQVQWAAFRDHFNVVVVKPEFQTKGIDIKVVAESQLMIFVTPQSETLKLGESKVFEFTVYAGPQNTASLKKYGLGLEKVFVFSNFFFIEWFAKAIHYAVPFIQGIIKSWGMSIVVISILIYGLSYPLTLKSMTSMRKMQQVQPKVKALQDRFKNDPSKLNAEIMAIYKKEKINPLSGCLPFLLQMPIFMALYQALWRSHYFQGKSFLWIKDLTLPDRLFIMPFQLPFLGNEFNILPILMGIVMFLQQKVSAKNMVITDEQQAMQQKMMMYFFPIFIAFIFYKFASGLSLYFTVFYLLSTITQWKISKAK